jgi:hypothetical protein
MGDERDEGEKEKREKRKEKVLHEQKRTCEGRTVELFMVLMSSTQLQALRMIDANSETF